MPIVSFINIIYIKYFKKLLKKKINNSPFLLTLNYNNNLYLTIFFYKENNSKLKNFVNINYCLNYYNINLSFKSKYIYNNYKIALY